MEEAIFDRELRKRTDWAEKVLNKYLPKEEGMQKVLAEAMNYSLTAGGKRLRPILMWEVYRMCGGEDKALIEAFMAAIEMIHTYSLVHDDLPAMDNDQYRRGKRTTWSVYGDAMGILAGDGLLNYAFETVMRALRCECCEKHGNCGGGKFCCAGQEENCREECTCCQGEEEQAFSAGECLHQMQRATEALALLAEKAGIYGMIGGQAVDIISEGQDKVTEEQLMFIHAHKTAALIQAAMMVGAILAGASGEQVSQLEKCAYNVGIAFQIQDDILDVTGDSRELGKSTGSDDRNHKQTYVTWKGLEQAEQDVETLSREAAAILDGFAGEHEFLKVLILNLMHRKA